jgi:hypothetical protein
VVGDVYYQLCSGEYTEHRQRAALWVGGVSQDLGALANYGLTHAVASNDAGEIIANIVLLTPVNGQLPWIK